MIITTLTVLAITTILIIVAGSYTLKRRPIAPRARLTFVAACATLAVADALIAYLAHGLERWVWVFSACAQVTCAALWYQGWRIDRRTRRLAAAFDQLQEGTQ